MYKKLHTQVRDFKKNYMPRIKRRKLYYFVNFRLKKSNCSLNIFHGCDLHCNNIQSQLNPVFQIVLTLFVKHLKLKIKTVTFFFDILQNKHLRV